MTTAVSRGTGGLEIPQSSTLRTEELLAVPDDDDSPMADGVERASAEYEDLGQRFLLPETRTFSQQFSQLYFARLAVMKPRVLESAKALWPDAQVRSILQVSGKTPVVVVGTLYKDMALKPCVLDEYTAERDAAAAPGREKYIAEDDSLVLEDEGARMRLVPAPGTPDALPVAELVTGIVLAVLGCEDAAGDFEVTGVAYAAASPPRPIPPPIPGTPPRYVALVSALGAGGKDPLRLQLAVEWITGYLGSEREAALCAGVVRLIVAGCAARGDALVPALAGAAAGGAAAAAASAPGGAAPNKPLGRSGIVGGGLTGLDVVLATLATALPVDVMPGEWDPANLALPQQPLHPCLLPSAAKQLGLRRCTNPHSFAVGGVTFLGTSGQPLDDVHRYAAGEDRVALLASTLRWRHLAPTSPDTLACYPFPLADPFVLPPGDLPHVYFAGGQPEFGTAVVDGTRVVCVPRFSDTGCVVLLNLMTLECHPLYFSTAGVR